MDKKSVLSAKPLKHIGVACLLFGTAALGPNVAFPADDYSYRLEVDSLGCIIKHREDYLSAGNNPVFIDTDKCPPDKAVSLTDVLTNTNEAPDLNFSEKRKFDHFLSLPRSVLEKCLGGLTVPPNAKVVRFFPASCRIELDAGGQ